MGESQRYGCRALTGTLRIQARRAPMLEVLGEVNLEDFLPSASNSEDNAEDLVESEAEATMAAKLPQLRARYSS